jgi:uncharacterized membrane protein
MNEKLELLKRILIKLLLWLIFPLVFLIFIFRRHWSDHGWNYREPYQEKDRASKADE